MKSVKHFGTLSIWVQLHPEGEWNEEYSLQYHVARLPGTYQLEIIIASCKYYRSEGCLYFLINKQQFDKVVLIGQAIGNNIEGMYIIYGMSTCGSAFLL